MWIRWQSPQNGCHSPLRNSHLQLSHDEGVAGVFSYDRIEIDGSEAVRALVCKLAVEGAEEARKSRYESPPLVPVAIPSPNHPGSVWCNH